LVGLMAAGSAQYSLIVPVREEFLQAHRLKLLP
jgi:hypothetical protein